MTCGEISASVLLEACGKGAASGTEANVYLMNYADIDRDGEDSVVTGNVLSKLTMKAGKKIYQLQSKGRATTGTATFNRGTYFDTFSHSVVLRAFTKNQETKDFMNNLAKGARLVVIVENIDYGKNGDTKFEVYGWDSGLTLSELAPSTDLTDNVTYSATLASDDNSKESQLPLSYFKGTYDATLTELQGMLADNE